MKEGTSVGRGEEDIKRGREERTVRGGVGTFESTIENRTFSGED